MILYTKNFIEAKKEELKERVSRLDRIPKLVIIKANDDPASARYVANKRKMCQEIGVGSCIMEFDKNTTNSELRQVIEELNYDESVTGILLQLPLYKHLDEDYLVNHICPYKDVDGFNTFNAGRLALGDPLNIPCTPLGIVNFLEFEGISLLGKTVCIVNASNIVGKPLAQLLLTKGATPIICHSKTSNIQDLIDSSDIIVTATSQANLFGYENFLDNQIIIDVSINIGEDGKLCGDLRKSDYDIMEEEGIHFTPVPGGVGPLTVITLIEQTIKIAEIFL